MTSRKRAVYVEREIKKKKASSSLLTSCRDIHDEECKYLHYCMSNSVLIIVTNKNETLPPHTAYFRNKDSV